jgi:hypothetical protein
MLIPSLILLAHGFAAGLGAYGQQQWAEAVASVLPYSINPDELPRPEPVAAEADNFMSQPFLKTLVFQKNSTEAANLESLTKEVNPFMALTSIDLTEGKVQDFTGALNALGKHRPGLLADIKQEDPAERQVLRITDKLGIPWPDLVDAAQRPQSQLPPTGSWPPDNGYTAPQNTLVFPSGIFRLANLASLRTHAALASGQPDVAMETIQIQSRLADAYMTGGTLVHAIVRQALVLRILHQAKAGCRSNAWRETDLDWLVDWAASMDDSAFLKAVWRNELYFGLHSINHLERNPWTWDLMYADFKEKLGAAADEGTLGDACNPFGQQWLKMLRSHTGTLYRLAPAGAFQWWRASWVKDVVKEHLLPLRKGGLFYYAWPPVPRKPESSLLSAETIGINCLTNQSHCRLLAVSAALQSWHKTRGDYPDGLVAFSSRLAPETLLDPFSAKPLRYQRISATSYRLYSIGQDLVNDQGAPMKDGTGDLGWSRP